MSSQVAVTGAAGSLGRVLVRQLRAAGHQVRALVRREAQAAELREQGVEVVLGDVRDESVLRQLLEQAEVVFHVAAWMGKPFNETLAYDINVRATENLVRLAAQAGVRRVVLASSVAVYGPVRSGLIDETAPLRKVGDLYGDSKIEAEEAARRASGSGLELTILRPAMIYGPASPSWTLVPFEGIRKGSPMIIGDGNDIVNPVFVEDVARAFALAGFHPDAANDIFNVAGEPTTWNTFFGYYATMTGTTLRRVPAALARGGATLAERASRLVSKRPQVVAEMVNVMTSRASFSGAKAGVLGFKPAVSLEEGMRQTEAWLREHGYQKRPRVALVTGAGSGLGKAIARGLQQKGLQVWASDVSLESLGELENVHKVALDVTSEASIQAALAQLRAAGDTVDLLVNVAGLSKPGALEAQPFEEIQLQFEVNAYGPLRLARALAPAMRARGYGRIINISSTNGFVVTPFMGAYSASKFALEALSDSLRLELKPWGVDVITVEPGAMKTPFAERAQRVLQENMGKNPDWQSYLQAFIKSPLWGTGNATQPEKVAKVIIGAALSKRPKVRILATLDAVPSRLVSMLPAVVKDQLFSRLSGLSRKPPSRESPGPKPRAS